MDHHLARLHEAVNQASVPATETLSGLTAHFQGADAPTMTLKQMMAMVRQQAAVMSYADVFLMLTVLFVGLAVLGVIMKRPGVAAGGGGH